MLYTKKGDTGTTKTFRCDQRISKSSDITEALGALDELNSFLGFIKAKTGNLSFQLKNNKISIEKIIDAIQSDIFIVQAELAGSKMTINKEKVQEVEQLIDVIEKELPPIKSFIISGATELSALFDFSRAIARRAERRLFKVVENNDIEIGLETKAYLNRLSSVLYALARLVSYKFGVTEQHPNYK